MNLQGKIDRIKNNLDAQSYTVAAGEAVKIIEFAIRKLLVEGLVMISEKDRLKVMQSIIEIGKGEKGVESFGLGQMLAVLRKSKFNDAWEAATNNDLSAIKMINLDALNQIRIKLTHDSAEASKFEAEFLYHALQGIIQAFGILSLESRGLEREQPYEQATSAEKPPMGEGKNLTSSSIAQDNKSSYSPIQFNELDRLRAQAKLREEIDLSGLKYALNLLEKKSGLVGLDLGCSEGFLTHERFSSFGMFEQVFGIDKSSGAIEKANSNNYDGYDFYVDDVESKDGFNILKEALSEKGLSGIDVVFSAAVFHHLKNPIKVLRGLRKLMNPGGVIVIRTLDDQLSLSHPDPECLVDEIFELSERIPGMSNRHHAREIYHQLWKTGFREQKTFLGFIDTAGKTIEERRSVYKNNFEWRPNYIRRAMESFPKLSQELQLDLEWLENALEELEMMFESEDYFHMEPIVVAVGQKK